MGFPSIFFCINLCSFIRTRPISVFSMSKFQFLEALCISLSFILYSTLACMTSLEKRHQTMNCNKPYTYSNITKKNFIPQVKKNCTLRNMYGINIVSTREISRTRKKVGLQYLFNVLFDNTSVFLRTLDLSSS